MFILNLGGTCLYLHLNGKMKGRSGLLGLETFASNLTNKAV